MSSPSTPQLVQGWPGLRITLSLPPPLAPGGLRLLCYSKHVLGRAAGPGPIITIIPSYKGAAEAISLKAVLRAASCCLAPLHKTPLHLHRLEVEEISVMGST